MYDVKLLIYDILINWYLRDLHMKDDMNDIKETIVYSEKKEYETTWFNWLVYLIYMWY